MTLEEKKHYNNGFILGMASKGVFRTIEKGNGDGGSYYPYREKGEIIPKDEMYNNITKTIKVSTVDDKELLYSIADILINEGFNISFVTEVKDGSSIIAFFKIDDSPNECYLGLRLSWATDGTSAGVIYGIYQTIESSSSSLWSYGTSLIPNGEMWEIDIHILSETRGYFLFTIGANPSMYSLVGYFISQHIMTEEEEAHIIGGSNVLDFSGGYGTSWSVYTFSKSYYNHPEYTAIFPQLVLSDDRYFEPLVFKNLNIYVTRHHTNLNLFDGLVIGDENYYILDNTFCLKTKDIIERKSPPTISTFTYTYSVDDISSPFMPFYSSIEAERIEICWGDGNSSIYDWTDKIEHQYETTGEKTVTVTFHSLGSCYRMFYNNLSLLSVEGVFAENTTVVSFEQMFYGCSNLTSVSPRMFSECKKGTNFYRIFSKTGLTSAPEGLFEGCESATSFREAFAECGKLAIVKERVFAGCINATNFQRVFYRCSSQIQGGYIMYGLQVVEDGVFEGCVSATTFQEAFYACNILSSIPSNLFEGCSSVSNFSQAFTYTGTLLGREAYEIEIREPLEIGSDLFKGCTNVTSFESTFRSSGILNIPSDLFRDCINVTTFNSTFRYSLVSEVPSDLFAGCIKATDFERVFSDTFRLHTVGSRVFKDCISAINFRYAFYIDYDNYDSNRRSVLTTVGSEVFAGCVNAVDFEYVFFDNYKLTTIGDGMFKGCESAINFTRALTALGGDMPLTSIPHDTFEGCVSAENFGGAFQYTKITEIPENLFSDCVNARYFGSTFYRCSSLTAIPDTLFDNCSNILSLGHCFTNCVNAKGIAPDLWNRSNIAADAVVDNCFYGCTGLLNYSDIPIEWRTYTL